MNNAPEVESIVWYVINFMGFFMEAVGQKRTPNQCCNPAYCFYVFNCNFELFDFKIFSPHSHWLQQINAVQIL